MDKTKKDLEVGWREEIDLYKRLKTHYPQRECWTDKTTKRIHPLDKPHLDTLNFLMDRIEVLEEEKKKEN
jgi:hypothetical protein